MKRLLGEELEEAREISRILVERIDMRVRELREIEARLDRKMAVLKSLLGKVPPLESGGESATGPSRIEEVVRLGRTGLQVRDIAALLDMPVGEVDLILSVNQPVME